MVLMLVLVLVMLVLGRYVGLLVLLVLLLLLAIGGRLLLVASYVIGARRARQSRQTGGQVRVRLLWSVHGVL